VQVKLLVKRLKKRRASIQHFAKKVHLKMATVADRHPTRAPAQMFPRLGGAFKVEPAQLAGSGVTLWTRLGGGGVTLLAFGDGMLPLQPLILPRSFDIFPRELVIILVK
jgi:hypothetical protein